MKYAINRKAKETAYMQLYRQLRADIVSSVYKYGDRLPSKRLLAEETSVALVTVRHAYEILCDEGYAEARERSGYYASYRKDDFTSVSEQKWNLTNVNPNYRHGEEEFPFSVFAKTARNVLTEYGEQIFVKSPNFGSLELRRAIANYLARAKGINVGENQIVIGSGAEYLYGLIVQFLGREKIYALENPSYEKILSVYRANGAECELLSLGTNGILTSELNRSCAEVLHITPCRSFPSGITASASKRNEYIRWAAAGNKMIIEDDFDSEFTVSGKHEDTVFSMEPNNSVIYVNTFTKTIAPSMRIGYMVLPKNAEASFREKMGFYSCTVPILEQYILAELINNGDFERHINRVRRKRRQELKNYRQKE